MGVTDVTHMVIQKGFWSKLPKLVHSEMYGRCSGSTRSLEVSGPYSSGPLNGSKTRSIAWVGRPDAGPQIRLDWWRGLTKEMRGNDGL